MQQGEMHRYKWLILLELARQQAVCKDYPVHHVILGGREWFQSYCMRKEGRLEMNVISWNKKAVINFHKEYKGGYAGDVSAPEIIRLSRKYIQGRVLDVGSGSGTLVNLIPNAVGVDLVPKHANSVKADITNLPFKDGSFDTAFCTELLEHLCDKDLDQGLNEIGRVLSEEGHLIVTVPYKENLEENMVVCPNCSAKFHRWGHMQTFDEEKISIILRNNFDIVKLKILPIGFMARHKLLKHFRIFLEKIGFLSQKSLFFVSKKRSFIIQSC